MPISFRSFRCLLLVLSSVSLSACNSSGSNSSIDTVDDIDDRPTVVSADGATIRENADTEIEGTSNSATNESVSELPADDQASASTDTEVIDSGPVGEINTIDDLLAHLEAKRNAENEIDVAATAEPATDETLESPLDSESVNGSVTSENIPIADSAEITPDIDEIEQPAGEDPLTEPVDATDPGSVDSDNNQIEVAVTDTSVVDAETDAVDTVDAGVENGDSVSNTVTEDTQAEEVAEVDSLLQDDPVDPEVPEDATTDGSFSSDKNELVVNCDYQLPCAVSNVDGAVAVVVENVYRHPETQRLAIALSVTANRDTALRWDNDITSTDDVATTYNGTTREFSGFYQFDRDNDMVTLLAGTALVVVQHFREMPLDTTVSMVRFDTGYIEAGVRTAIQFSNLPLDPVLGDIVDCAGQVPCTWVANDQSYAVNVLKTSGLWQTGRLRVDFEVRSSIGMGLSLFSAEPVVGNDGSVFTPRTHSLGSTSDYQEFTVQMVSEGVLAGHQDFLKNANRLATSLVQVKLGMTRVNAPGAGSPVFRNLPLE